MVVLGGEVVSYERGIPVWSEGVGSLSALLSPPCLPPVSPLSGDSRRCCRRAAVTHHTGLLPLPRRHFPRTRLTDLPGQWLQCLANGSNVYRVLRTKARRRPLLLMSSKRIRHVCFSRDLFFELDSVSVSRLFTRGSFIEGYNYFTEMCSSSEAGSYLKIRLIDFLYRSTLGLRVIKKKRNPEPRIPKPQSRKPCRFPRRGRGGGNPETEI